jgi:hypothetical protein
VRDDAHLLADVAAAADAIGAHLERGSLAE